ncbi:YdbH domain-containing protein [Marinobacteraceae bacterium S3BR75-40.1]
MSLKRIAAVIVVLVLTGASLAGLYGWWQWQDWKARNGIQDLRWQGAQLHQDELRLDRVSLVQQRSRQRLEVTLDEVRVAWQWAFPWPQLQAVAIERAAVRLEGSADSEESAGAATAIPAPLPSEPPSWLPRDVRLSRFHLELPCATGQCVLEGGVTARRAEDRLFPLHLTLDLIHQSHQLRLASELTRSELSTITLNGALHIDQTQQAWLFSTYEPGADGQRARLAGSINIPSLPQTDWLLAWLRQWQPLPDNPLPDQPRSARMEAAWDLQLAGDSRLVAAKFNASAHLPDPWPLPGVGAVTGDLQLAVARDGTSWHSPVITADLTLTQLADWSRAIPERWRPRALEFNLVSEPSGTSGDDRLPLKVKLDAQGPLPLTLRSRLAVTAATPWQVAIERADVRATLGNAEVAGWSARNVRADLQLSGDFSADALSLQLAAGSQIRVDALGAGEAGHLSVNGGRLSTRGMAFDMAFADPATTWQLSGPVTLKTRSIAQAWLNPQPWSFEGQLEAGPGTINLEGLVSVADLKWPLWFSQEDSKPLGLQGRIKVKGGQSAAALNKVLAFWPDTLSLEDGSLSLNADVQFPPDAPVTVDGELLLHQLGGVYDRLAFSGLSGAVDLGLDSQLTVATPGLTLKELNPGIPLGPLSVKGRYTAPKEALTRGTLALNRAEAGFMSGRLWLEPASWSLDSWPLRAPVKVAGVSLSRLLEYYPSENVSGTGRLDGVLPLVLGPEGVQVEQGKIQAQAPGGRLSLPADRILPTGGNRELQMVSRAVENFHYSVLSTRVNYDLDGKLMLDLQLQGRNPDYEKGPPIHLNISLEEDIPALLTSLQLSGRVNDTITQRVRERLEKAQ